MTGQGKTNKEDQKKRIKSARGAKRNGRREPSTVNKVSVKHEH